MAEINPGKRPKILAQPTEVGLNFNISDKAKVLFSVFYLYHNKNEGCWASNQFLASQAGIDERSVSRNISLLEKWGYIIIKNKRRANRRRIFISDYEKIYGEAADEVYSMRREYVKDKIEVQKKLFLDARNKYFKISEEDADE